MSTNHHTPHSTGDALNASVLNSVYSDLDSAITTNAAAIAGASGTVVPGTMQGRLTLSSTLPVTTSDVTGATTLYLLPYRGELVALYDGTSEWAYFNLPAAGVSVSIPATTDTNYDVYLYDNSGTLALELVAWTNDTTRATALATQDGVRVKSGDATRLYVGFIRTTGVSGECEDSRAARFVANYYNRMARALLNQFTGSHSLSSTTFRAWNNDAGSNVEALCHADDIVKLTHHGYAINAILLAGIGLGSSTVNSATMTVPANTGNPAIAAYAANQAEGYVNFIGLEKVTSGTGTVFGSSDAGSQLGLIGEVMG